MTRPVQKAAFLVALLVAAFWTAGCGPSGPALYPVSGTVTLDGQPLADGLVYFKTVQTGAVEVMDVRGGQFQGKAQQGDRRVEIYSFRTTEKNFDGMKSPVKEELIPKRYNQDSALTASVSPGGPNQFTFDLRTK